MKVPVVGEVSLAAGSNLNSGDPLSGVLTPGVEGATHMLSVIELPVAALDNFGDNHQFIASSKGVDAGVAAEGLHDPNEFRHLKKRRRRKLVDLHRKGIQNSRQNRVTGEPESADEEVAKDDKFSVPRGRDLLIKRGSPSARREEPGSLIFPNHNLVVVGSSPTVGAKLLVGIGPEGWTPTQQPPELSPSLRLLSRDCYFYLCKEGKCRNLTTQHRNKEILSRPKTERTAVAFGALFSLQGVRFITRGSLFIGDPWV
jgi:hypothetical protein